MDDPATVAQELSPVPVQAVRRSFPPQGVPRIGGINRLGLWTLYMKEVRRFFKVQTQTIWAPAMTTLLYLMIFTVALGGGRNGAGREVLGVPFASFIAPGLIIMGMINNAFANASFCLLVGKIQGTIVDYLQPPLSTMELLAAVVGGAMTRALIVGVVVWVADQELARAVRGRIQSPSP